MRPEEKASNLISVSDQNCFLGVGRGQMNCRQFIPLSVWPCLRFQADWALRHCPTKTIACESPALSCDLGQSASSSQPKGVSPFSENSFSSCNWQLGNLQSSFHSVAYTEALQGPHTPFQLHDTQPITTKSSVLSHAGNRLMPQECSRVLLVKQNSTCQT